MTPAQLAAAETRLGVLNSQGGSSLTTETAVGFSIAEIECGWGSATSSAGVIDPEYISQQAALAAEYKAAGWQVAVSAGIFDYPTWLPSAVANWQNVDQGGTGSGSPNFVWNPAVRALAAEYISALTSAMAEQVEVDYYRIGLSPSGEAHFQDSLPISTGTGSWWAFDPIAQAQGPNVGLPEGIGPCPLPGWIPGATTWNNGSGTINVTIAMATEWWNWYQGAINNAHQWEMDAHKPNGYDGCFLICMPGWGESPQILENRLANLLGNSTIAPGWYQANIGSYWPSVIDAIADPDRVIVNISSVYDGSGSSPVNNYSASPSTDLSAQLMQADWRVSGWSSARWISYLAQRNGNYVMGESVGNTTNGELASLVSAIMTQAQACGLYAILWANDLSLYTGGSNATPAQVATGFKTAFMA